MVEQIRLIELLREDALYKQWFMKPAKLKIPRGTSPKWRLFVQKEKGGRWARADFETYAEAYTALRLRLPNLWDATIHSKVQAFRPPVVRIGDKKHRMPMPPGHDWCEQCRRPVVFRYFRKHPNLSLPLTTEFLRCSICGMRQVAMRRYRSRLSWPAKSGKSSKSTATT